MLRRALLFKSDKNYWQQAQIAVDSARRWNPGYDIHVLTDGTYPSGYSDIDGPAGYGPRWLAVGQSGAMVRLLESGYDQVVFVDSDTFTYGPYREVENSLGLGASILVTPHVTAPLPIERGSPCLVQIAKMGNYNAGFVAASTAGISFLKFVTEWTAAYNQIDSENYIAAEQGWLRFALDFDSRAHCFRHPGYNYAYWNCMQRPLTRTASGELLAAGRPLRVAHFSGMTPDLNPNKMSRYQNRVRLEPKSLEYKLFADYQKLLVARGGFEPPTLAL